MPVGEMLSRMSSREIEEWKVYFAIEAAENQSASAQQKFDF